MKATWSLAAAAALAAAAVSAASAATIVPFTDGPGSAARAAKTFNRLDDFVRVTCRYRKPELVCKGYQRMKKTDSYVPFTFTFRKTSRLAGYVVRCYPTLLGCQREKVTYTA